MVSALPSTSFSENMLEAKEAGDFFRSSVDQFPNSGDGFRACIHLHLYMALLNLKLYQFQQSADFLRAASKLLKERVTQEEEDRNEKHKMYNLRTYAQILMAKGERHTKMHDHELAFRVMYKAMRVMRVMDQQADPKQQPDKTLWVRYYEQMAIAHITQKELI